MTGTSLYRGLRYISYPLKSSVWLKIKINHLHRFSQFLGEISDVHEYYIFDTKSVYHILAFYLGRRPGPSGVKEFHLLHTETEVKKRPS